MKNNYFKIKISFLFIFFAFAILLKKKKTFQYNFIKLRFKFKIKNNKYISLKKQALKMISKSVGHKITSVESFFCSHKIHFGNQFMILNNIIYYCEILGCKNIILDKRYYWYITNPIFYKEKNIYIKIGNINNYFNTSTIIDKTYNFFNKNCKYRINVLKNEIIRNLPKVKSLKNDLYIYIRSGYISTIFNMDYFQPPLCFYKNIIDNNRFKNIYIIAKDKTNKIIDILLNYFGNIKFKQNSIKIDIAYLVNAYNVAGSISSFLYSSLRLNNNLEIFWKYGDDNFKYRTYKKTIVYRMEPSKEYKDQRYLWKYNSYQIQLMIKDKCPNRFEKISN